MSKPKPEKGLASRFCLVTNKDWCPFEHGPCNVSFCHLCDVQIPTDDWGDHLESECHKGTEKEVLRAQQILFRQDSAVEIADEIQLKLFFANHVMLSW